MEIIEYSQIKTLEEYKNYNKQKARLWYLANREKKLQYNKNYYYSKKSKSE